MASKYFFALALACAGVLPAFAQTTVTCSYKITASSGNTCASVASAWGLSDADFVSLNPGVACPALVVGQTYCVLGKVTTVTSTTPGPTSTTTTSSSSTKTTSTSSITTTPAFTTSTTSTTSSSAHLPTQTDLAANCELLSAYSSAKSTLPKYPCFCFAVQTFDQNNSFTHVSFRQ